MKKLFLLLDIEPGEARPVALLFLMSFLLGAANNFVQTSAFPLFLTQFNASLLPWTYLLDAVLLPLLTFVYLRAGGRMPFRRLLIGALALLAAITAAFRLGLLFTDHGPLVFALPILFQVVVNFGSIGFWTLAGRTFNVRQGKRLFGLLGAGQWLAIVITGLLIPALAGIAGTANLLVLAVLALCAELGVLVYTMRALAPALQEQASGSGRAPAASKPRAGQAANPFKNGYAVLIFVMTLVWWAAFFFLDNIFYDRAGARYPDAGQLAGFLGLFLAGLGVVTLLCNTFLSGRLIGRLGVRRSMLVLPAVLLAGTGLMAVTGSVGAPIAIVFWLAVVTKVADMSLGFSVDRSALTLLYQPLPAGERVQVQATAEGIFQPLAAGLAGLGLLALAAFPAAGTVARNYGVFLIVAAWLAVVILLGRRYPAMLLAALGRRRLTGMPAEGHLADPRTPAAASGVPLAFDIDAAAAVPVLHDAIRSPHAGVAIYALNALQAAGAPPGVSMLEGLLCHGAPEVRQEALRYVEGCSDGLVVSALLPAVRQLAAEDGAAAVRGAAVRVLAAGREAGAAEEAIAYLADTEPTVRAGALTGLLRSGNAEGARRAGEALQQMAASPEPAERARAAQVLGRLGNPDISHRPLLLLLQDTDATVRAAALAAAGHVRDPRLWPPVIDGLEHPATRRAAAAALAEGGETAVTALAAGFARSNLSTEARAELLKAGGRGGGPAAVEWLRTCMQHLDPALRGHALAGLCRAGYRASGGDAALVEAQLRAEARLATDLAAAQADLGNDPTTGLLRGALAAAAASARERVFWLLSFIHDPHALLRARDSLALASPEQRAYALEVLDGLLSQDEKRTLFALLAADREPGAAAGAGPTGNTPADTQGRDRRLEAILRGEPAWSTDWMKACALYALGHTGGSCPAGLAGLAEQALCSASPLVRETAVWALSCAGTQPDGALLAELCRDPDPAVARAARELGPGRPPGRPGLITLQKVAALRGAGIFAATPDEVLVKVAGALTEVELPAGAVIFHKGEPGDAMYLVVEGEVRTHDGERALTTLRPGDGFGEMAVLDAGSRSASATTTAPARLLRLAGQDLYPLIDERPEVARGIIRVLSRYLRDRLEDLAVG